MKTIKNYIKNLCEKFSNLFTKLYNYLMNPRRTAKDIDDVEAILRNIVMRATSTCKIYNIAFPVSILRDARYIGIPCPWSREVAVY